MRAQRRPVAALTQNIENVNVASVRVAFTKNLITHVIVVSIQED